MSVNTTSTMTELPQLFLPINLLTGTEFLSMFECVFLYECNSYIKYTGSFVNNVMFFYCKCELDAGP